MKEKSSGLELGYSYHVKVFNISDEGERSEYEFLMGEAYENESDSVEVLYTQRDMTTKEFLVEYRRKKPVPEKKKNKKKEGGG
jgi:hypothetical protein